MDEYTPRPSYWGGIADELAAEPPEALGMTGEEAAAVEPARSIEEASLTVTEAAADAFAPYAAPPDAPPEETLGEGI